MPVGLGAARRLSLVLAAFAILGVMPAIAGVHALAASGAPASRTALAGATSTLVPTARGHAYLSLNSDLRAPSHLSAWAIDRYLTTQTVLPPLGHAFKSAEAKYGVNALYLLAHAMHETAFGTSFIAQRYHNLFGWQAFDRDPTRFAMRFPTFGASVDYVAQQVAVQYLSPTGKFYGGAPTLRGMHYYASDPHWGQAIVGIANGISLPTLAGLRIAFKTPVAGTLSTGVAGRITVTSNGRLPDGLRAAFRFVPVAIVEAGATTGAIPSTDPPFRLATGSSRGGTMKLSVVGPTRPGRYRLELELRDSDGTELTEGGVPSIPDAQVRVYGADAVIYDLKQTKAGLSVSVTNVGRRDIPAVTASAPKGSVTAATRTSLTAWLIDASGAPVVLGQATPSHALKAGATWKADFPAPDPLLLPAMLLVRLNVGGDPARLGGSPPGVYRLSPTDPPTADDADAAATPNTATGGVTLPGPLTSTPSTPPAPSAPSPNDPLAVLGGGSEQASPAPAASAPVVAPAATPVATPTGGDRPVAPGLDISSITPVDAATRLLLDPAWKPAQVKKPTLAPKASATTAPLRLGYLALVNPKQAGNATLRITNLGTSAVPGPKLIPAPAAAVAGATGTSGATGGSPEITPGATLALTAVPAWGPATAPISFTVPLPAGIGVGKALDLPIVLPAQSAGQSTFLVTARVTAADGRAASMTVFWLRSAVPTLRAPAAVTTHASALNQSGSIASTTKPVSSGSSTGSATAGANAGGAAHVGGTSNVGGPSSPGGAAALPGSTPAPHDPPLPNLAPSPSRPDPAPPPTPESALGHFGPPLPLPPPDPTFSSR